MEVGIDSFAAAYDEASLAVSAAERVRDLLEQITYADQVGLDVFGIGEHHRKDYLDSAPAVLLGAAAVRTQRIRMTAVLTHPIQYYAPWFRRIHEQAPDLARVAGLPLGQGPLRDPGRNVILVRKNCVCHRQNYILPRGSRPLGRHDGVGLRDRS